MFPIPRFDIEEPLAKDKFSDLSPEQARVRLADSNRYFQARVDDATRSINSRSSASSELGQDNTSRSTQLLIGCNTIAYSAGPTRIYNSAMLFGPDGSQHGRYDKMHPVMFGEYIPLTDLFPFL